jgi:hemerythrin-like domain-containing protein
MVHSRGEVDMEFTVYVETEDPRFTGRTFQLRDEHGDVWDAFASIEDLLEGAREFQRDAQSRANEAQEEADGFQKIITRHLGGTE